jgi:hypothetical protein
MAKKWLSEWRSTVLSENGPPNPTTRLVLLGLSQHMNATTATSILTIRSLATETGLSCRTIITHLKLAEHDGWIGREVSRVDGRGWKAMAYSALRGGESLSPPQSRGGEPLSPRQHTVTQNKVIDITGLQRGGESLAPPQRGSESLSPPQTEIPIDEQSSTGNQTSLTSDPITPPTPSSPPSKKNGVIYPAEFEAVWALYPKRTGGNPKKAAYKAWQARIRAGVGEVELLDGVRRYALYCSVSGNEGSSYVKMASTFFGPDEWWKEEWSAENDNGRPELTTL